MRAWRIDTLVVEVVRNVVASWPRTLVTAIVVAGLVGSLTWSELSTSAGILTFHRDFVAAGGNVFVASSERELDAGRCSALAARGDVIASGALVFGDTIELNTAPGTLFQRSWITTGILGVWAPGVQPNPSALIEGAALGHAAASELGISDGMYLGIQGELPTPLVVVNVELRNPQAARWVLQPMAPIGLAGSCWVEMEPGAANAGQTLLEHVFSTSGPDLVVRPWVALGDFARDPVAELARRPERVAWIAGGAILTLLTWLGLWFRRSEISLYRILGATRTGLWFQMQVEVMLVLGAAGTAGYLWASAAFGASTGWDLVPDQYAIAARTAVSTVMIPMVAGPVAALIPGGRNGLLAQLKEA